MRIRTFISVISALVLLSGCTKASLQNTYNNQESKIDSFIKSLDDNYRKNHMDEYGQATDSLDIYHNKGSHRVVITRAAEGAEALGEKGIVSIYYAGYTFSNSKPSSSALYVTNKKSVATDAKWPTDDESQFEPLTIDMGEDELMEGLMNGLVGVKAGEECYILFSGEHAFGNHKFGTIPANSALFFQVWVESLTND